jgi:hypothetical protein
MKTGCGTIRATFGLEVTMFIHRVLCVVCVGCALALPASAAPASGLSVQVRKADVRSTPSFLGAIVGSLAYADRVTQVEKKGDWIKISRDGTPLGWVHQQSLTSKQIVLKGGEVAKTGASSDELALAGKGFTEEVEKEYKAQNKDIDFAPIDRMEKITIAPEKLAKFLKAGDVSPAAGDTL